MKKRILHRNEKDLIRTMYKLGRPISVNELSDDTGMSWITVKKYLLSLLDKKVVVYFRGKKERYELNKDLLKVLYVRKHENRE